MILDPFGGPGGWAEGLLNLGLSEVGIELDADACATRRAAGHRVIRADVTRFPVEHLAGRVGGLIMSPPCQAFSMAGNGGGRGMVDPFVGDVDRGDWGCRIAHTSAGAEVLEVGRWFETIRPRWVACEQVPPVLPIWRAYAARWRALYGWSTWTGILNAADFGVPQTRQRAFLIARTDGAAALPPQPTHARDGAPSLFGDLKPWVSMAEALSWTGEDQPARTVAGEGGRTGWVWRLNRRQQADGVPKRLIGLDEPAPSLTATAGAKSQWIWERPATTIAGDPRCWPPGHKVNGDDRARLGNHADERYGDRAGTDAIKLTLGEALILQGFRPDYPLQGTKTSRFRQLGNAVPPPLASAVIGALLGIEAREQAA